MGSEVMDHFFNSSTIHGFSYFSSDKPILHRLLWIGTFLAVLIYGVTIIKSSQDSWDEMPVLTTMEPLPVEDIPFPG
jgi:arginine exporter protein ArgO